MGLFHHGDIDRDVRTATECIGIKPPEIQIGLCLLECIAAAMHHLGDKALKLCEHGGGTEQEHAAVPGETAAGEKLLSGAFVGLFNETGNRTGAQDVGAECVACLDIAVARFRGVWDDPECHQPPCFCSGSAGVDSLSKALPVANDMVCRQDEQQGIFATGQRLEGCDCDRRSCVSTHWLQQDGSRCHPDLPHLFGHDEAVVVIADQQRSAQALQSLKTLVCLLQKGVVAGRIAQRPVLLRIARA